MNTLVALLKDCLALVVPLVVSLILISIFSDAVWTLVQTLGVGNALTAFAIDVATALAMTRTVFGWAFSL